jgi:hypothetical protein
MEPSERSSISSWDANPSCPRQPRGCGWFLIDPHSNVGLGLGRCLSSPPTIPVSVMSSRATHIENTSVMMTVREGGSDCGLMYPSCGAKQRGQTDLIV